MKPKDIRKFLQSNAPSPISEIKDVFRDGMRVVNHYLCDHCDQPILNPQDGFIIHGNIYQAFPGKRKGLVGNNFPNVSIETPITVTDVKEKVYCKTCFMVVLELKGK
jgi:hypothetical protein